MRLFVANLPREIGESELASVFCEFGTVDDVVIVLDRETRQSRGFGFIDMPDAMSARYALWKLHKSILGGRRIEVREAHGAAAVSK